LRARHEPQGHVARHEVGAVRRADRIVEQQRVEPRRSRQAGPSGGAGYNADAGRCLVMQAVIDGRDVVIILLNSWGTLTRIGDANRVRHWLESGA
jgi:D-alanyl-D-alanine endopeptidase (penicillin-binding protein 7)